MSVNIRIRNGMMPDGEGNGGASEGDIRGDATDFITTTGVVDLSGGHLLVHEDSPASMDIIVDAGVGYIPNASFDEEDSDSVRFWEAVVAGVESERTLTVSANSSGSTRIDLVCLRLDTGAEPDYYASDVAELLIVKGTPGAGAPALPSNHLLLAQVEVVDGATEIEDEDITDSRTQVSFNPNMIREIDLGSDAEGDIFYRNADGNIERLGIGGEASQLSVDENDNPAWVEACMFRVRLGSDVTGIGNGSNTLITFDTEDYDIGSNFDTGASKFTAPVNGIYEFYAQAFCYDGTTDNNYVDILLWYNNTANRGTHRTRQSGSNDVTPSVYDQIYMSAGDTIEFKVNVSNGDGSVSIYSGSGSVYSYATGRLVRAITI